MLASSERKISSLLSAAIVLMMLMSSGFVAIGGAANGTTWSAPEAATPPSAPLNLTADQGPGFIWLWWDHPASAGDQLIKKYMIYRGSSAGGEAGTPSAWVYVGSNHDERWRSLGYKEYYNDSTGLVDGTRYYYYVTAISDSGESPHSNEANALCSGTGPTPDAPYLSLSNTGYSVSIMSSLPSGTSAAPGRYLYLDRTPTSSSFPKIWCGEPFYSDDSVTLGTSYTYTLRAMNAYGLGAEVSQTITPGGTGTQPSAPENLTISSETPYYMTMTWARPSNPSSLGFTYYDIYRSTSISSPWTMIGSQSSYMYYTTVTAHDNNVVLGTTYYYKVVARGTTGSSADSNIASGAASDANFVSRLFLYPGDNQILVTWDYAFLYVGMASGYDLYRSTTPGGEGVTPIKSFSGTEQMWYDNTTSNGVTHYYTIRARSGTILGPMSSEASATPNPGSPSAPPTLVATPTNDGVKLSFAPTTYSSYGYDNFYSAVYFSPNPYQYEIFRGASPGTEALLTTFTPERGAFSYEDHYLIDWDVNYYYQVRIKGMYGWGPMSNEAMAFSSPSGETPDPVADLNAASGSSITLTWNTSYAGTHNLLNYMIIRFVGDVPDVRTMAMLAVIYTQPGPQTFVDNDIESGMTYHYYVMTSSTYGSSTVSNMATATSSGTATVPGMPRNVQGTPGNQQVSLTWEAPESSGGSSITGYRVYRSINAGSGFVQVASPTGTAYTDVGLTNGVTYYYKVSAVNGVGEGAASSPVPATPSLITPSGSFVSSTISGLQETLTFGSFSAPVIITDLRFVLEDTTASTSETWQAMSANDETALTNTSSSPYPMPQVNSVVYHDIADNGGVNMGDTLLITYSASFPAGHSYRVTMIYIPTGDVVNMISFNGPTSTTQAPGPVQNLAAIGANAQVLISWQAPTSDGGSAVTGYRVYRSLTSGGEYEELAAPTALNYTDTGLMNGQAYYYKVSAVNAIGEGAKAGPATATPATTPSAPQSLSAVSSVGKVSLTWQAPSSNGGAAITRFDIYRGLTPETIGTTPVANVNGGVLLYDDATVSASTTYYYKVKAVNSVGPGPASNIANATTPAPTAPGAPQNPTASPGPSKVTITWQAPASDGGSPITGYKVFSMVNDTPVLLTTVGAGTLSYVHSNPPDVMNVYYITAANAVGEGAHSTTVTAQPQAATTDNSMLYLGVVAAVVVVGVIVAYLVMRKKK